MYSPKMSVPPSMRTGFTRTAAAAIGLALLSASALGGRSAVASPAQQSTTDVTGTVHCVLDFPLECGFVRLTTNDGSYSQTIQLGSYHYSYRFRGVPRNADATITYGAFDGVSECTDNVHIGEPWWASDHVDIGDRVCFG